MKKITTWNKHIAIAGACLLVASLVGACSPSTNSTTTTNLNASNTTAPNATSVGEKDNTQTNIPKPDKIRWMVHDGLKLEDGTAEWAAEFEKQTGIPMHLEVVSNNEYQTLLELAFASGTQPDLFDLNAENLSVYASQNAVADLTDLVKASPLYKEIDPAIWEAMMLNGKIYGIPREIPQGQVTYVRKDWLDRLGMVIPKTYEEYVTMLTRFKNEIPECKVPVTAAGAKNDSLSMALPEFFAGATTEFTKIDGKWIDGMAQENMTSALANLQEAYGQGLIDKELVTNTTSNCRDQWYAGTVGTFTYWPGVWAQTLTERLKVNYPEAEVVAIPSIEGSTYERVAPGVLCISSKLSPETVVGIFKYYFEFLNDGKEGQVLNVSGVENIHWKQEGDKLVPLPSKSNPDETLKKVWAMPYAAVVSQKLMDKNIDWDSSVLDSLAILALGGKSKTVYPVSPTFAKIKSDLSILKQEVVAKVIMGEMTVAEGVEKYKIGSTALNMEQVLVEMNTVS